MPWGEFEEFMAFKRNIQNAMLYPTLTDLSINYENTVNCQEEIVEKTEFGGILSLSK